MLILLIEKTNSIQMKLKHFINLEWKQYFRSAYWQKSMALNVLLVFVALYFVVTFLALGIALYPILKDTFPDQDPLNIVNSYLFYWFLADVIMRFFFQKLPVMSVKPLLTLPVKRSKVVNYVLAKSCFSFFNFLPLFAIIPFGTMLLGNGYPAVSVVSWMVSIFIITLGINFLNFIIENFTSETELSFLPIIALGGSLFALNYFNIVSFTSLVSGAISSIYDTPLLLVVPLLLLVVLYVLNYSKLKAKLYLDSSLKTKVQEVNASNLEWTRKFGDAAPFMQLDLKLIWRNKRPRSSIFILLIGLLYGLFFYPNPVYQDQSWMFAFIGIFVTGIFLINFGQFIPAWDSGYYKMLMSQNIPYKQYLKSKFTLMAVSVVIMFILSIPYVYFGWNILLAHLAAAIYNIGINTHVILYAGSFNRKKIDLNQRAAFNYQGTGAVQWLLGIPLMFLPLAIFGGVYALFSFEIGCLVLAVLGLVGVVFHQKLMTIITTKYLDSKYKMIQAFGQDN
ncbi:hypothetical protein D778_01877 [Xanthomarina gelatinilytica]|uniref:Uncharacterized protein n=1 Tax=Xanthomarina gelatinilytica TaxID=1137281 RepID=M7MI89_9FLAO|nr:DUF5687 family protein [Xanthomarina gelatinilytica]EMQ95987.1 hypothetical protein D778_01877 [Xanthomarina gelatinilytica]